ncbi:hypothetical protein BK666_05090 [Pseudomonas frederiksbergensis]|uniref:Uncharacterized protein n=1 Tax=Pseudomonas frederiksbergensis TaxID=104087 RepID=A0A423KDV9_9PSED|nr:hypothetical protein [Pseudomonas frederiksbergensis]RON50505.1 hypothetical protein BK666_05090 [Pseudomonas frederiksbergensis]
MTVIAAGGFLEWRHDLFFEQLLERAAENRDVKGGLFGVCVAGEYLSGEPFISYPQELDTRRMIDELFAKYQVERRLSIEQRLTPCHAQAERRCFARSDGVLTSD